MTLRGSFISSVVFTNWVLSADFESCEESGEPFITLEGDVLLPSAKCCHNGATGTKKWRRVWEATFCVAGGLGFNRLAPFLSCDDVRSLLVELWNTSLNALVDRTQLEAADSAVECGTALWVRMCSSWANKHALVHEWAIFAKTAQRAGAFFNEHVQGDNRHPLLLQEPAAC